MPSLHDELVGGGGGCKLCAFLSRLPSADRAEWEAEIALPITVIAHTTIVGALKRRDVNIEEASVRRHRSNHIVR